MNEEETQQVIEQLNEDFETAIWEALDKGITNKEIFAAMANAVHYVLEKRTSD